jgi:hypothetical protein
MERQHVAVAVGRDTVRRDIGGQGEPDIRQQALMDGYLTLDLP